MKGHRLMWVEETAVIVENTETGVFLTGHAVPVEMDIDEIVRELAGCVLHGSWGTGCDFDYAEARAIILRIGGDDDA